MQSALIHFLNHGLLPFVGREEQLAQIEQYWRQTADASGLRALLLVGEAGVGKSRLVEEVISRIAAAGGATIHAKLYPDSATSIAPLLVRALGRSNVAQSLLKVEPQETLASVVAALVRICSLRPTLLVLEDIHLLGGDALREFASLLDRLCDEPLSLLCAARPVEVIARGALERFLVDEIELPGLTTGAISDLCYQVLGQDVGAELATALEQKTCGNALAIRSALRGALKPGTAPSSARPGHTVPVWGRIDRHSLADTLERNVRLLSEGMAAHLNDEERHAAERVATLGEVFARESAMALLEPVERAERLLSQLLFKGIITTAISTANPLDDHRSIHSPLSFTHSLLHRYFIENGNVEAGPLVRVVAGDLPLYSAILFQRLAELEHTPTGDAASELRAFDRALVMGVKLRRGSDWKLEEVMVKAARVLLDACRGQWSEEEWLLRRVCLSDSFGSISQHTTNARALRDHYLEMLEMASDERFESLRIHRLHALGRIYWHEVFLQFLPNPEPHRLSYWLDRIRELLERYPELKLTREYVEVLNTFASIAARPYGPVDLARVEQDLDELLETPGLSPELATWARVLVTPHFLKDFETPEGLVERTGMLAEIKSLIDPDDVRAIDCLFFPEIAFHKDTLRADELLEAAEEGLRLARERSSWQRIVEFEKSVLFARLMIDLDFGAAWKRAEEIIASVPEPSRRNIHSAVLSLYICNVGIFSHNDDAIVATIARLWNSRSHMGFLDSQVRALAVGDLHDFTPEREPVAPVEFVARDLAAVVLGRTDVDREAVMQATIGELAGPVFIHDSIVCHTHLLRLLAMLPESDGNGSMGRAVVAAMRVAIIAVLQFLADRDLYRLMQAQLEKFGRFLSKPELATWKGRYAEIRKRRGGDLESTADQAKIHISMFGAVTVQQPSGEPERVKGAQLCTLLGLLVADQLQESPLTQREFMALAIGSDRDPDSARKSLNFAVFRLREILGNPLAIDTGGETPRLATDLVRVDFIEATRSLERARQAHSEGALMRAVPDLLESLRLSDGQVAYPALYEEFFEAAREDYETTLRRVVLGVARALMHEGDNASAEEVLTRAYSAMSDDEELGELLQQVLVRQGKRARAARISLRVAEEV